MSRALSRCRIPIKVLIFALSIVALEGCLREKDRLDAQVREMCAKDGGMKVYEQVRLPPKSFDEFGEVRVPFKSFVQPSDAFFYESETTYFQRGNPEMWRTRYLLMRQSDGKVLGESVVYLRRGGDLPGPWPDSSFSCPERSDIKYLSQSVFHKGVSGR